MIRPLTIAAAAVTACVLAVATSGAAQRQPIAQCMTDDGYGRYRPCSSLYWQGSNGNPGKYGTNSTFPKATKQQPF
jgi:hypothetical protein